MSSDLWVALVMLFNRNCRFVLFFDAGHECVIEWLHQEFPKYDDLMTISNWCCYTMYSVCSRKGSTIELPITREILLETIERYLIIFVGKFRGVSKRWRWITDPIFLSFQVFHQCDEGKKGYLTREDIKVAVVSLFGYKPSKVCE